MYIFSFCKNINNLNEENIFLEKTKFIQEEATVFLLTYMLLFIWEYLFLPLFIFRESGRVGVRERKREKHQLERVREKTHTHNID